MSTPRPRTTRRRAEQRLTGARPGREDALDALLDAAARPTDGPAPGEETAVAQFRVATAHRPVTTSEGSLMTRLTRKLVAAPIVAVAVGGAAVASCGVALAASQGALHVPFTGHDNRSDQAPAAPASTNPGLSGTATQAPGEDTDPTSDEPTEGISDEAAPTASPSPSTTGLCHAWLAGAGPHNGMDNPAFAALAQAAGGEDGIATYCAALVTPPTHPAEPAKPAKPTQAAQPTHPAKPTQAARPSHPARPDRPTQAARPTHPARPATPDHASGGAASSGHPGR